MTTIGRLVVVGHLGSSDPGKQITGGLIVGVSVGGGVGQPGKLTPGKQGLGVNCGHLGSSGLWLQLGIVMGGLVFGHLKSNEPGVQIGGLVDKMEGSVDGLDVVVSAIGATVVVV